MRGIGIKGKKEGPSKKVNSKEYWGIKAYSIERGLKSKQRKNKQYSMGK